MNKESMFAQSFHTHKGLICNCKAHNVIELPMHKILEKYLIQSSDFMSSRTEVLFPQVS